MKTSYAPTGLITCDTRLPTACAVGYHLSPLRGCKRRGFESFLILRNRALTMPQYLARCRSMWRWLFRMTAGLSLLLSIAAVGVWVRSYWVYDVMYRERVEFNSGDAEQTRVVFRSWRGTFVISRLLSTTPGLGSHDKIESVERRYYNFTWEALRKSLTDLRTEAAPFRVQLFGIAYGSAFHQKPVDPAQDLTGGITASRWVVVPWAVIALLFLLFPACWVRWEWKRYRRRRWQRKGRCARCGYDLRGSAEGCPECGMAKPSDAVVAAGQSK